MKRIEKESKHFYTIIYDINNKKFIPYDVIPHLKYCYDKCRKKPTTLEEFIHFVDSEAKYQWWSRCEYEIILNSWPSQDISEKWDIYKQVKMNIEIITKILMEEVK